jgi:transcriptional regulator with XRE-family HTH domain
MIAIGRLIKARGLTQVQAARLFGVTQPRVSDLVRGRIELFSIDGLVEMLGERASACPLGLRRADVRLDARRLPGPRSRPRHVTRTYLRPLERSLTESSPWRE